MQIETRDYLVGMSTERKKSSKNRGRPRAGDESTERRSRATERAARGESTAAANTVKRGLLYRTIYQEWRSSIDCTTIAAKHDMSPRRVQQIVDELRAASIEAMDIGSRFMAKKVLEELLVQMMSSVSEAALLVQRALEEGNLPVALGAMKRRDEARVRLIETMKEIGLIPRQLKWVAVHEEHLGMLYAGIDVLERHGVSGDIIDEWIQTSHKGVRYDATARLELDVSPEEYGKRVLEWQLDEDTRRLRSQG
jgi:hypothetical protein